MQRGKEQDSWRICEEDGEGTRGDGISIEEGSGDYEEVL